MGIHLILANNIQRLAEDLSDRLVEERRACGDPFIPQTLLVPNPHLTTWLQIRFADHSGLSMNHRFPFLEKGLWDLSVESWSPDPDKRFRQLEREKIQLLILALLLDKDRIEGFSLFKDYLTTPPGLSDSAKVSRAWQLSERLARLFSDYEYRREEMIAKWIAYPTDKKVESVEACERDLYLALFGENGSARNLSDEEFDYLTLPQLSRSLKISGRGLTEKNLRPIHLFGFSQLSPFHLGLLFELAANREVYLYAFNHSRAVWGEGDPTQGPVEFWGRPGTELIQLIEEIQDKHPEIVFEKITLESPKPRQQSLLSMIQESVRNPDESLGDRTPSQDRSIQIVGCPGRYREVETVYNSILENMSKDPSLDLTDIAVLVTDMNEYKPLLESVFNRPRPRIPFNLSDSTAEKDSLFALGVQNLLSLADSRFTRREVFDFLFNPLVMEALGISREEVRLWLEWSDTLNLFGGNPESEPKPFDWRSGLRRLALGRIMETPAARPDGSLAHYHGVVPYSDLHSRDAAAVGGFARAIEPILKEVGSISMMEGPTSGWIERLHRLCDRFLKIPSDRADEHTVRESLFKSLENLELLESSTGNSIPFPVFRQFVEAHLKNLPSQRGRFLTGGVTLSSMRPLRPIPFEIVYILGLDEGQFPGNEEDSTLDLRWRSRRLGDVTTPEANRYLFLETLMVAGRKLYLTYPDRDLQKDREIAPCSVVEELKRVARHHLIADELEEISIPISGSSESYLRPQPEWSDARVNFSERDRLLCLLNLQKRGDLGAGVRGEVEERVRSLFGGPLFESEPLLADEEDRTIQLHELKRFLENPLESIAQSQLGLFGEDDADPGLAEDEPFYSEFPSDYEILTSALERSVLRTTEGESTDTGQFLENLYEGKSLCGEAPSDLYGDLDREGFEATIHEIEGMPGDEPSLSSFLQTVRGFDFYPLLQIGESSERVPEVHRFHAHRFDVEGEDRRIRGSVHGSLPMVWRSKDSLFTLRLAPTSTPPNSFPSKQVLIPYLFYLSLLMGQEEGEDSFAGDRPLVVGVQFKDRFKLWKFQFDRKQAENHLTSLLADYLMGSSFESLPLQIFWKLSGKASDWLLKALFTDDPSEDLVEEFQELIEEQIESLDSDKFFREMEQVQLLDAGPVANAFSVTRRRLFPFLNAQSIADIPFPRNEGAA